MSHQITYKFGTLTNSAFLAWEEGMAPAAQPQAHCDSLGCGAFERSHAQPQEDNTNRGCIRRRVQRPIQSQVREHLLVEINHLAKFSPSPFLL